MALPARTFGDYTLIERVEVGDLTETWRARCELVGAAPTMRLVSRVLPHLAGNRELSDAFRSQAQLASAVRHVNLETLYEVGLARDEGSNTSQAFVAHELLAGQSLHQLIAAAKRAGRWPMPTHLAATIVFDLLAGLQKLHARADGQGADACSAHGEINPANVKLGVDGSVKLLNLGLALPLRLAPLRGGQRLSEIFAYRAPEQLTGVRLAPKADLFSVGMILAELVHGSRPVERERLLAACGPVRDRDPQVLRLDHPKVRCPKCRWAPPLDHRWTCTPGCGARITTFYTLGWCPSCAHHWTQTACGSCKALSDHLAWYASPQEIASSLESDDAPDHIRVTALRQALRALRVPESPLSEVFEQALTAEQAPRFSSAQHFGYALDQALQKANLRRSTSQLAEWVKAVAGDDDDDQPTQRGPGALGATLKDQPPLAASSLNTTLPPGTPLGESIDPSWTPALPIPLNLPPRREGLPAGAPDGAHLTGPSGFLAGDAPLGEPLPPSGTTFLRLGAVAQPTEEHPAVEFTDPGSRTPQGGNLVTPEPSTEPRGRKVSDPEEPRTDPNEAEKLGRYRLVSRLGRGGMAETWKAVQQGAAGVTRPVVIKRILPHLVQDPQFVAAFINEAKVSSNLSHGNIAAIYDFGEADGQYFLAMEFVLGRTLEALLERATEKGFHHLPPEVACFICIELLKGLHYAHTRVGDDGQPLGIVHRDVSPDNVIVGFDGQTKVLDFGIAKARVKGRIETEPGLVKGKWNHFSPEQAAGEKIDARSDVFAAGIVLYRMVCGQQPFPGAVQRALRAIVDGKYPPPAAVNPTLSTELSGIITRALENPVASRWGSALEMENALRQHLMKIAPEFSADALRSFVLWLFDEELAKEGVGARASKAEHERFERWAKESRLALETAAQAAKTRSMLNAVTKKDRRLEGGPLLYGALALMVGLVGYGAYALLRRPAPTAPPPVVEITAEPAPEPMPTNPAVEPEPPPAPPEAPRRLAGRIKDTGGNVRVSNEDAVPFTGCKLWMPPDRFYAWPATFTLKPATSTNVPKGEFKRAEQRLASSATHAVLQCKEGVLRVRP
jgi:eukaryotic-like serine/threonine-protein kinase